MGMVPILGMLICLLGVGTYTYFANDHSIVATLNAIAWTYAAYMLIKIVVITALVPNQVVYQEPRVRIPPGVDRENPPVFEDESFGPTERVMADIIKALITKIGHAADEAAIHAFVSSKLETLRRVAYDRYRNVLIHINVVGFEGIIGTLIGLITFMAQATVLFEIPEMNGDDSGAFISTVVKNLNQIDLLTVSTAFLTSIIGWCAKAWIGQWVDIRMGAEDMSITDVESWIQDEILARLNLPTQVSAMMSFANLPELHGPLLEAVQQLTDTSDLVRESLRSSAAVAEQMDDLAERFTDSLGPQLERVVGELEAIARLTFDVSHIEGGIRLVPRRDTETEGLDTERLPDAS